MEQKPDKDPAQTPEPGNEKEPSKVTRGMYKGVRISVKTLDKLIIGGILVIAVLIMVGISRGDGYRVTYDSKGGSDVAYQTYLYDEPLDMETPQREGYDFEGWYFDEGYGRQAFDGMNVQSDLTLYAKWRPADSGTD